MSFSISRPTLITASQADMHPSFLFLNYQMNLASDQCLEQIQQIFERTKEFFVHCYADVHLFGRSFISMFGSTTGEEIARRIQEVHQFKTVVMSSGTDSTALRRFERLSEATKNLFFYTTADYAAQFTNEVDPTRAASIRSEIVRECDRVISFQQMLSVVNAFFRGFTQRSSPSSSEVGRRPAPSPDDLWERIFGRREGVASGGGEVPVSTVPRTEPLRVDFDIPNTLPYNSRSIPAAITAKAAEIDRLSMAFAGAVPARFRDPIGLGFMAIPVFDASHPVVQSGLPALRVALNAGSSVEDFLNARHHMDHESMNAHMAAGGVPRWWETSASAACPNCRHPTKPEALRIDTGLQDQILTFLRTGG